MTTRPLPCRPAGPAVLALGGAVLALGVALAAPPARADTPAPPPESAAPEALMAAYRAHCSTEARQTQANQGKAQALERGAYCADLARRIQGTPQDSGRGAAASPLARPGATLWPGE